MNGLALVASCVIGLAVTGCASNPDPRDDPDYLRWVAFRSIVGKENLLLRWRRDQMPLKVHVMQAPEGLFDQPADIHEAILDGILNWSDVIETGVPTFTFVQDPADADIPVVWEEEPVGGFSVAQCVYHINIEQHRFGVSRILMTGRWAGDRVASKEEIYRVMLHEMGHALGLAGHSPNDNDIMGRRGIRWMERPGITLRDRTTMRLLYERPIGTRMSGAKRESYW